MRLLATLMLTLILTGCDGIPFGNGGVSGPVDPNNLPALSSREQSLIFAADGAFQQGNYAAAERDYMTAAAESKGRVESHLALAKLYEKTHQPQKKKEILERALGLQPQHPLANYLLGRLLLNSGQHSEALTAFQHGRASRPDDMDLTIGEAVSQDMLGNHVAAQQLYTRVMQNNTNADLSTVRTNLAMSYILSDAPQKAIDLLQAEASKPGASTVTRHNLALAYGLLGRHGDAKSILRGDIDEETRTLAIARMKSYHQDHLVNPAAADAITELKPQPEPATDKPAPVVKHSTTTKKKPAATAGEKPAAEPALKKAEPAPTKTDSKNEVAHPGDEASAEEAAPMPKVVVAKSIEELRELAPAAGTPKKVEAIEPEQQPKPSPEDTPALE